MARANLLRVRGDLKAAKETLLAVLAERPNDRDTLDLLARTCEDAGEAEEARRWRGLAGEAIPTEGPIEAAARISLPSWALLAVAALGLIVIALAFAIGRSSAKPPEPRVIGGRVEAPGAAPTGTEPSIPAVETTGSTIEPTIAPPIASRNPAESGADAAALELIRSAEAGAGRTLGVSTDPRTATVTITFSPRAGEAPRREAASLARVAFASLRSARTLQMRALKGRELLYVATASRDRLAAVEADGWAQENETNLDALADALLSEEWTAPVGGSGDADGNTAATP